MATETHPAKAILMFHSTLENSLTMLIISSMPALYQPNYSKVVQLLLAHLHQQQRKKSVAWQIFRIFDT